jgi:hypothetical protein
VGLKSIRTFLLSFPSNVVKKTKEVIAAKNLRSLFFRPSYICTYVCMHVCTFRQTVSRHEKWSFIWGLFWRRSLRPTGRNVFRIQTHSHSHKLSHTHTQIYFICASSFGILSPVWWMNDILLKFSKLIWTNMYTNHCLLILDSEVFHEIFFWRKKEILTRVRGNGSP